MLVILCDFLQFAIFFIASRPDIPITLPGETARRDRHYRDNQFYSGANQILFILCLGVFRPVIWLKAVYDY